MRCYTVSCAVQFYVVFLVSFYVFTLGIPLSYEARLGLWLRDSTYFEDEVFEMTLLFLSKCLFIHLL